MQARTFGALAVVLVLVAPAPSCTSSGLEPDSVDAGDDFERSPDEEHPRARYAELRRSGNAEQPRPRQRRPTGRGLTTPREDLGGLAGGLDARPRCPGARR